MDAKMFPYCFFQHLVKIYTNITVIICLLTKALDCSFEVSEVELQAITFTFGLIPLDKIQTPLFLKVWIK